MQMFRLFVFWMLMTSAVFAGSAYAQHSEPRSFTIEDAVNAAWRSDTDRARDQYRHPVEALQFWGLQPGMVVVDIDPGSRSWWPSILAPFANRTDGRYIAAYLDLADPEITERAREARTAFEDRYADRNTYGPVETVDFGMVSGVAVPDGAADFVLVARAFHNWAQAPGATERFMAEFFRVLKSGGVLAVEQHRAPVGAAVEASAPTGYVPENYVIAAAERAGFRLAARSEINANPLDDRDHPFGVWTLPPYRLTAPFGQPVDPNFDRVPFDAVGESDRMTLRFVKPG